VRGKEPAKRLVPPPAATRREREAEQAFAGGQYERRAGECICGRANRLGLLDCRCVVVCHQHHTIIRLAIRCVASFATVSGGATAAVVERYRAAPYAQHGRVPVQRALGAAVDGERG